MKPFDFVKGLLLAPVVLVILVSLWGLCAWEALEEYQDRPRSQRWIVLFRERFYRRWW